MQCTQFSKIDWRALSCSGGEKRIKLGSLPYEKFFTHSLWTYLPWSHVPPTCEKCFALLEMFQTKESVSVPRESLCFLHSCLYIWNNLAIYQPTKTWTIKQEKKETYLVRNRYAPGRIWAFTYYANELLKPFKLHHDVKIMRWTYYI